jgi:hypothetical protein
VLVLMLLLAYEWWGCVAAGLSSSPVAVVGWNRLSCRPVSSGGALMTTIHGWRCDRTTRRQSLMHDNRAIAKTGSGPT